MWAMSWPSSDAPVDPQQIEIDQTGGAQWPVLKRALHRFNQIFFGRIPSRNRTGVQLKWNWEFGYLDELMKPCVMRCNQRKRASYRSLVKGQVQTYKRSQHGHFNINMIAVLSQPVLSSTDLIDFQTLTPSYSKSHLKTTLCNASQHSDL